MLRATGPWSNSIKWYSVYSFYEISINLTDVKMKCSVLREYTAKLFTDLRRFSNTSSNFHGLLMHQSIPAAPSPSPRPGYCGAFARLFSPGGGAFENFALPEGRAFAPGGGGGTAIYGLYRYVPLQEPIKWAPGRCEGYGFLAVYSRIGYINQSVWV